ncbi:hypothetical protein DOY81_010397 [Sarcophaga bullata]|nr:hypothetical protein DOY81_010397 [Sarcophaga bullata]
MPHATMGTQGFYCLQPPPPAIQQVSQVVTQSPSVQSNRNSNPINLSKDNNPNDARNDLVAINND